MNKDFPFGNTSNGEDSETIIHIPRPGGIKLPSGSENPTVTSPKQSNENAGITKKLRDACARNSGNPITGAAIPLLSLVTQLRSTVMPPDVPALRLRVIDEIKQFVLSIKSNTVSSEQAQAASYILCTFLDETVLNTPWGPNSIWFSQGLLVHFHKEAFGGEKFFLILNNCMQTPAKQLDLLELLYFCLCLGFQGRYRVQDQGAGKLDEIRENTYQIIQRQRGDVDRTLSLQWQGIKDKRNVLAKWVPLWVIAAIASLLLMSIFLGFVYSVNAAANPVLANLYMLKDGFEVLPVALAEQTLGIDDSEAEPPMQSSASLFETLSNFLEPEVRSGEIELLNRNGRIVIRIMSKGFFGSGSDKISIQYYPLLDKISQALSQVSDRITVVGHTDSSPIFSAKFPSNWDLSKARALSVTEVLINNNKVSATIVSEGRADTQPMVLNDSAEHKAMNRRVEIVI